MGDFIIIISTNRRVWEYKYIIFKVHQERQQGSHPGSLILDSALVHPFDAGASVARAKPLAPKPSLPATAKFDPHVKNLLGERFDVNQPGDYMLLRLPQDHQKPALIKVDGLMLTDKDSACGLFIKLLTVTGDWLAGKAVQVRPHKRNLAGGNNAGNATVWPFAIKVSSTSSPDAGPWIPPSTFNSETGGIAALTDKVSISARYREEYGDNLENQTYEFRFGAEPLSDQAAVLTVAQAPHQALNVELSRLGELRRTHGNVGGLLGMEKHDRQIERLTRECQVARMGGEFGSIPAASMVTINDSMVVPEMLKVGSVLRAAWT